MGGDAGPVVGIDGQAGDVQIGSAAGRDIYHQLADLPPAMAEWAADQQEVALRMIDALDRVGAQVDAAIVRMDAAVKHLRSDVDLYRLLDASDRAARRKEADRRWWGVLGWVAVLTAVVTVLAWAQWMR